MLTNKQSGEQDEFFLPNFCGVKPLFVLIIGAELLAIVLILATGDKLSESWDELGLLSIFVQWIALTTAAILCFFRNILKRASILSASIITYMLILLITAGFSVLAQLFLSSFDYQWGDSPETLGHFVLRCVVIAAIIGLVAIRYFYMQQQWKRRIELESEAKVEALQSRIRPHFLFNSMNIIASLITINPTQAEQAVEDLSELFRATLRTTNSLVPIHEEWSLCKNYLRIEGLRLGKRLKLNEDFSQLPNDASIPMLTLQPLMENAIYHGIQPIPEGGTIEVHGLLKGNTVEIQVINPVPEVKYKGSHKGNRIALENIKHRLHLLFGSHANLISEVTSNQYTVTLRFPYLAKSEVT